MKVFKTFTGIIAPLDRSNVDTDAIIPKEYLKDIIHYSFSIQEILLFEINIKSKQYILLQ